MADQVNRFLELLALLFCLGCLTGTISASPPQSTVPSARVSDGVPDPSLPPAAWVAIRSILNAKGMKLASGSIPAELGDLPGAGRKKNSRDHLLLRYPNQPWPDYVGCVYSLKDAAEADNEEMPRRYRVLYFRAEGRAYTAHTLTDEAVDLVGVEQIEQIHLSGAPAVAIHGTFLGAYPVEIGIVARRSPTGVAILFREGSRSGLDMKLNALKPHIVFEDLIAGPGGGGLYWPEVYRWNGQRFGRGLYGDSSVYRRFLRDAEAYRRNPEVGEVTGVDFVQMASRIGEAHLALGHPADALNWLTRAQRTAAQLPREDRIAYGPAEESYRLKALHALSPAQRQAVIRRVERNRQ